MSLPDSLGDGARAVLFSGHMVDRADRARPRFPAAKVPAAAAAIARELARIGVGPGDVAYASGACGGDLLFLEAAAARGLALEVMLPFEPAVFAVESVDFAGSGWRERFARLVAGGYGRTALRVVPAAAADASGDASVGTDGPDADPYERTNRALLAAASRYGARGLHCIVLWDGQRGDGRGGTAHMVDEVMRIGGSVVRIDPSSL